MSLGFAVNEKVIELRVIQSHWGCRQLKKTLGYAFNEKVIELRCHSKSLRRQLKKSLGYAVNEKVIRLRRHLVLCHSMTNDQ